MLHVYNSWSMPVHMASAPARLRTPLSRTASVVQRFSPVPVVDVCAPPVTPMTPSVSGTIRTASSGSVPAKRGVRHFAAHRQPPSYERVEMMRTEEVPVLEPAPLYSADASLVVHARTAQRGQPCVSHDVRRERRAEAVRAS
jgi:hypothetical protein